MINKVGGFQVEVTLKDEIPRVRVWFANGEQVLETDALSIKGMENMGAVFAAAARMAYDELDCFWARQDRLRDLRSRSS